ncbi:MAG TPA: S-layer protein, partial [Ruminiclostridium sp.]|nr:S-layer protein [Ruminiclostridium sp.]
GKMFTMAMINSKIDAGESIVYTETLGGDQYKAIKDKIASMRAYVLGSSDKFNLNTEGYEVILK